MKEQKILFPVMIDKVVDGKPKKSVTISKLYMVDSYPDYYVIDRKGILRFADLANAEVDKVVEKLLAEKP